MIFLSPIWLVALLPWGIVSIWLMWGRRKKQLVPFLSLGKAQRRGGDRGKACGGLGGAGGDVVGDAAALLAAARRCGERTDRRSLSSLIAASPCPRPIPVQYCHLNLGSPHLPGRCAAVLDRFGDGPLRIVDIITGVTTESDRGRWVTDIAACRVRRWIRRTWSIRRCATGSGATPGRWLS